MFFAVMCRRVRGRLAADNKNSGWLSGRFLVHILGIVIPTDSYLSRGVETTKYATFFQRSVMIRGESGDANGDVGAVDAASGAQGFVEG